MVLWGAPSLPYHNLSSGYTGVSTSLEGLMLKLKLQYFEQLMQTADSLEKTLMLGKIEGRKRRGRQRMRWLDGITDSMDMGLGKPRSWWWTGRPGMLQFMGSQKVIHDWATELNWTEAECIGQKYKQINPTILACVSHCFRASLSLYCSWRNLWIVRLWWKKR